MSDAARVRSFQPISDRASRLLILGSMPGVASLRAAQYYAHPRNDFWRILAALLGFDANLPYAKRVRALRAGGIALWDVLESCRRPGSLDSAVDDASIVVNDFGAFLGDHPRIRAVCFNGVKASDTFRRHVLPGLGERALTYQRLPSTSPANASLSHAAKLAAWRAGLIAAGALPALGAGDPAARNLARTAGFERRNACRPRIEP